MILVALEVRNVRDGHQQTGGNVETDFGLGRYLLLLCGNYCLQDLYKDFEVVFPHGHVEMCR
jgi:hypothetical protein